MTLVCPQCCAGVRDAACEPCSHYASARKYQLEKHQQSGGGKQAFLVEIDKEIEKQVERALVCIEKKDLQEAGHLLMPLIAAHHFMEAHYNLGVAYLNDIDVPNTVTSFREVVRLAEPDDFMAAEAERQLDRMEQSVREIYKTDLDIFIKAQRRFEEGVEFIRQKQWRRAVAAFKSSTMLTASTQQPFGKMGICYGALGMKEEAIKAFDRALEIDPHYELALVNREITREAKPGENLTSAGLEMIQFYKEYGSKNRSYIQELMDKNFSPADDDDRG